MEGLSTQFANPDSYPIDTRGLIYSLAFFSPKRLGAGQFYLMTFKDKIGKPFDGGGTYRLHVSPNAPVKQYWSATVYDRATHALIRNLPSSRRSSQTPGLQTNADGSVDIYFAPKAPAGKESNWVPTSPEGQFEVQDDTSEDKAAIQSILSQIVVYPLTGFDGKMKTKDWKKAPSFPSPGGDSGVETKWVIPEKFFDQLPQAMKEIPPLPGEESLYGMMQSVLDAAAKDPQIKATLVQTAVAAEKDLIGPLFHFRNNGRPVGNGWTSPPNGARWGTDYRFTSRTIHRARTKNPIGFPHQRTNSPSTSAATGRRPRSLKANGRRRQL